MTGHSTISFFSFAIIMGLTFWPGLEDNAYDPIYHTDRAADLMDCIRSISFHREAALEFGIH